jgi:HAD superfamily hydrolase (TIGR01490 family)
VTDPTSVARPMPGPRVAAFFDLDKTIIAKSSVLAFSRPFYQEGLINRRGVLKSAYAQFMFSLSGADADQVERMRAHLTTLCTGWDIEQVRAIVEETLHDIVDPLIYREAADLIAQHRDEGHDVIVVSASGAEIVAPIAEMVGATGCLATKMVAANGKYTGEIEFYCYGQRKAQAVRDLAAERGYDLASCHAYTDSTTDLPLLESVGNAHVVNPNRALRKLATERDWGVLTFQDAVSLKSRLTGSHTKVIAATAAISLGAVAAAGFTWYGIHRRRNRPLG